MNKVKKFAVIGNPIAHSLSPQIHHVFAKQFQIELIYEKLLADKDKFLETVEQFRAEGGIGLNVTLPFKEQAYGYVTQCTARANLAKACNTLLFKKDESVFGDNTDGQGLLNDLKKNHDFWLENRRLLIFGAGGTVRGLLAALADTPVKEVVLLNRTLAHARKLEQEFNPYLKVFAKEAKDQQLIRSHFDLIINTLPAEISEATQYWIAPPQLTHSFCYDVNYGKRSESFQHWAIDRQCKAFADGLGMLVEQAAISFQLWHQLQPTTATVIQQLRKSGV